MGGVVGCPSCCSLISAAAAAVALSSSLCLVGASRSKLFSWPAESEAVLSSVVGKALKCIPNPPAVRSKNSRKNPTQQFMLVK